jgi:hypothetical protein
MSAQTTLGEAVRAGASIGMYITSSALLRLKSELDRSRERTQSRPTNSRPAMDPVSLAPDQL